MSHCCFIIIRCRLFEKRSLFCRFIVYVWWWPHLGTLLSNRTLFPFYFANTVIHHIIISHHPLDYIILYIFKTNECTKQHFNKYATNQLIFILLFFNKGSFTCYLMFFFQEFVYNVYNTCQFWFTTNLMMLLLLKPTKLMSNDEYWKVHFLLYFNYVLMCMCQSVN